MGPCTIPCLPNKILSMNDLALDHEAAVTRLVRFLAVEGITGQEEAIAREAVQALNEIGVPQDHVWFDKAHEKIPLPTQTGNLIVDLPGTLPGSRRLFMTHLDTVPLCAGAEPTRRGNRIVPQGKTALGGDNRTGVACLVTLIATLREKRIAHPPLTFLFTVREESGLWGARFADPAELGHPTCGFNVDGRSPREITLGATGAERFEAEIFGRAAHAGVHPEEGVSAAVVAALALAEVYKGGWFGRTRKGAKEGTSNVGSIGDALDRSCGQATNVVTDYAKIRGEARSHDNRFNRAITRAYRDAFMNAAGQVTNQAGKKARLRFTSRKDYYPFKLKETSPVVQYALSAADRAGWAPTLRVTNGGLDANWLVRHGIPTVTFGAGQNNVHTTLEYVNLDDYLDGCRFALALATQGERP
jgi:tripeptide aminopeptidase